MRRFFCFFTVFFLIFSFTAEASEAPAAEQDEYSIVTDISGTTSALPSTDTSLSKPSTGQIQGGVYPYVFYDYLSFFVEPAKSSTYNVIAYFTVNLRVSFSSPTTSLDSTGTFRTLRDSVSVDFISGEGLNARIWTNQSQVSDISESTVAGIKVYSGTLSYNVRIFGEVSTVSSTLGSLIVKHQANMSFSVVHAPVSNALVISRSVKTNSSSISVVSKSSSVVGAIDKVDDTLKDQHQQEIDKGGQASTDASSAVTTLTTDIKSKWEILWYPITFTGQLLDVFVNGSSSASSYSARYAGVSGYTYDSDTGLLIPVHDYSSRAAPSGTVITFPAYTLPVLDVQLWESYSYDISALRTQFPAVFSALDVIITILELIWLIGFLRDKYLEVFG